MVNSKSNIGKLKNGVLTIYFAYSSTLIKKFRAGVQSKKDSKNQESKQSSITLYNGRDVVATLVPSFLDGSSLSHYKQEPRGQPFPFR